MELHTANKLPDWELVAFEDRNIWQHIAAKTNGLITPANAVTLTGNLLTFGGVIALSRGNTRVGLTAISIGRAADILDGRVAHATGTKSPLGEAFDAGFDKIQAIAAYPILSAHNRAPAIDATIVGSQQIISSAFSLIAKAKGKDIHPTQSGKLATAAGWASLLSHNIANNTEGNISRSFYAIGKFSTAATFVLGSRAIVEYGSMALTS